VADESQVVLVSSGVKGLYYLGRYDYELNASAVKETESANEFGRDSRTGRMIISTPESLSRVLRQQGGVLIVVDHDKVRDKMGVPAETVDLIESACQSVTVDRDSRVFAWVCRD
jgi:hypothetical protein